MSLITPAQVESYLGYSASTALDALIQGYIDACDAEISGVSDNGGGYLNQNILLSTVATNPHVIVFDGIDSEEYFLSYFPLPSNTAPATTYSTSGNFVLEYRNGLGQAFQAVDTTLFEIGGVSANGDATAGAPVIYLPQGFIPGLRNYRMTFASGWSAVPKDIQQVEIEMVSTIMRQSRGIQDLKSERLGVQSESDNALNVNKTTSFLDMRPEWKQRLKKYKVIQF